MSDLQVLRVRGEAYREGEREGLVTEPAHSQDPVLFSSCNISHNSWRDFRAKSAGLKHQQQTRTTIEMLTKAWLVRSCQKQIPVTKSSCFVPGKHILLHTFPSFLHVTPDHLRRDVWNSRKDLTRSREARTHSRISFASTFNTGITNKPSRDYKRSFLA